MTFDQIQIVIPIIAIALVVAFLFLIVLRTIRKLQGIRRLVEDHIVHPGIPADFVWCKKCGVLIWQFYAYPVPPYVKHSKRGDYIVHDHLCTRCKPKEKK